jgi:hypothetical protein
MVDENDIIESTEEETPYKWEPSGESARTITEVMANEAREASRLASRPNIDGLPDAVVKNEDGSYLFLAAPGEKLVVERFATVLKTRPWLDTKVYVVESIDSATGNVALFDPELHRFAGTNYIEGLKNGYRFKLPTAKTRIDGKRKRGRPRKNPQAEVAAPVPVLDEAGNPVKKKRGRPKGVKNRDKETIVAEKKAKAELKAAKKAAKVGKRKG